MINVIQRIVNNGCKIRVGLGKDRVEVSIREEIRMLGKLRIEVVACFILLRSLDIIYKGMERRDVEGFNKGMIELGLFL